MELEEMKSTWQRMELLLEKQNNQLNKTVVDSHLGRIRRGLRPLFWGQICQIIFAVFLILLSVSYWTENRDVWYQLASGLVVHAYAVMVIILSGITLSRITRIDYASPVTTIQKQLTQLRSFYLLNGMLTGLPWWFMWILVLAIISGLLGRDLFINAPALVFWNVIGGTIGLIGTWLFHRWVHQPKYSKVGNRLDNFAAGGSLAKAQKVMREIQKFEME